MVEVVEVEVVHSKAVVHQLLHLLIPKHHPLRIVFFLPWLAGQNPKM
jgi:hypothetical protein